MCVCVPAGVFDTCCMPVSETCPACLCFFGCICKASGDFISVKPGRGVMRNKDRHTNWKCLSGDDLVPAKCSVED